MSKKPRRAQDYSAEEFDQTVAILQNDASLRADIEAITGQTLDGKTPRELFDLFRSINQATEIQMAVVGFGRARQMVARVRGEMDAIPPAGMPMETAEYVAELQRRLDEEKRRNQELKDANAALNAARGATPLPTAGRVVRGQIEREAVAK